MTDDAQAANQESTVVEGSTFQYSTVIRGETLPNTIGVRYRTRPNGERVYSSFCMVIVPLNHGLTARRWISCGLYDDPEMAREARDKIALGIMHNPRTNNEPRHYYSEEIHRAVQNAHRMHPDLISAELAAGARELAELSGAMHGDAPAYSPSSIAGAASMNDEMNCNTFHRPTGRPLRFLNPGVYQKPSGKCHVVVELGGKTCHCGVSDTVDKAKNQEDMLRIGSLGAQAAASKGLHYPANTYTASQVSAAMAIARDLGHVTDEDVATAYKMAIEAGCILVHPNAQNDNYCHQISVRGAAPMASTGGVVSPCDEQQLKNASDKSLQAHSDQYPNVMNKAQGGADKTSTKLDDPLHQPVSLVPPRNVRLQGKTDMDSPSGSKGAFSSAPVHNYRHITAVPYAGGCWKAQVIVNGKLNSSKGLGSAALAARAADLMVYRRSLVDGAVGSSVTNTVLEDETKRLLEKMTVDQVCRFVRESEDMSTAALARFYSRLSSPGFGAVNKQMSEIPATSRVPSAASLPAHWRSQESAPDAATMASNRKRESDTVLSHPLPQRMAFDSSATPPPPGPDVARQAPASRPALPFVRTGKLDPINAIARGSYHHITPALGGRGRWTAQLFEKGKLHRSRPLPCTEVASHAADLLIYRAHTIKQMQHGPGGQYPRRPVTEANTNHILDAEIKAVLDTMTLEQVANFLKADYGGLDATALRRFLAGGPRVSNHHRPSQAGL